MNIPGSFSRPTEQCPCLAVGVSERGAALQGGVGLTGASEPSRFSLLTFSGKGPQAGGVLNFPRAGEGALRPPKIPPEPLRSEDRHRAARGAPGGGDRGEGSRAVLSKRQTPEEAASSRAQRRWRTPCAFAFGFALALALALNGFHTSVSSAADTSWLVGTGEMSRTLGTNSPIILWWR